MEDSFSKLIKHMQVQGAKYNPPSIDIGVVLNSDPLVIKIGDLQLTKENVLVADFLLKEYKRKISIPSTNASGSTSNGSITSIAIPEVEVNFKNGLEKDDVVACLATQDRQKYIILCRVVKA